MCSRFDLSMLPHIEQLENYFPSQRGRASYEVYLPHGKQEMYPGSKQWKRE